MSDLIFGLLALVGVIFGAVKFGARRERLKRAEQRAKSIEKRAELEQQHKENSDEDLRKKLLRPADRR